MGKDNRPAPTFEDLGDGWFTGTEDMAAYPSRYASYAWGEQGAGTPAMQYKYFKVDLGTVRTPYTPAPEDLTGTTATTAGGGEFS